MQKECLIALAVSQKERCSFKLLAIKQSFTQTENIVFFDKL
jgi:hypothetical protein